MHARTGTLQVPPDRIDEAVRTIEERLPRYREQQGYKGFTCLADREGGKVIGMSFWDSEANMQASEDLGRDARQGVSEAAGGGPEAVRDAWEVVLDDMA